MSRCIDADALKEKIGNTAFLKLDDTEVVEQFIDTAPSIDIVFCKECKHWERLNYEAPKEGWCDDQMPYSDGRWVDANDFCSYGERREQC